MGGGNVSCDFLGETYYRVPPLNSKAANGGAKRIVRFWGRKRTIECALQTQFRRLQKVGFAWSVPVPLRKTTGRKQTGGGGRKRIIGGGSKTVFGKGFMVCFPLP